MERLTERELYDGKVCFVRCAKTTCKDKCSYCDIPEEARRKLKEYEDLEEQGLLPKLPCKVGDTLWTFMEDFKEVVDFTVEKIEIRFDKENMPYLFIDNMDFELDCLGKTVFLTQAEAEDALQKMKETEILGGN